MAIEELTKAASDFNSWVALNTSTLDAKISEIQSSRHIEIIPFIDVPISVGGYTIT